MPSLLSRNYILAIAVRKHTKVESNFSCPVQIYWISLVCSKYFVRDFCPVHLPRLAFIASSSFALLSLKSFRKASRHYLLRQEKLLKTFDKKSYELKKSRIRLVHIQLLIFPVQRYITPLALSFLVSPPILIHHLVECLFLLNVFPF